ncbi:MAG: NAD(P)-dependent oxidoreductase [Acidimicrobiales bacterium]
MKIAVLGATGQLGRECVQQCLDGGHDVRVLARTPDRLDHEVRSRIDVVVGDGLDPAAVAATVGDSDAVLFAIGVDKHSPENLCTDVTAHILAALPPGGSRLVWCGGGSTVIPNDVVTLGSRFVEGFARVFLGLRHRDKAHQWALLQDHLDIEWVGVRPLQMRAGPRRGEYRMGYDRYSGLSKISFADCADAMIGALTDDRWLHQAPIVQY